MSNEFKDWYANLSEDQKKNYKLCMEYPILIPRRRFWGTASEEYQYEYTELDGMPKGWRAAFGEQWAKEIQGAINELPEDIRDEIFITDLKEKYGQLRQYFSHYTDALDAVIRKYENLSERTCICCGTPATKISWGWIAPYCNKCAKKMPYKMIDINEWFEDGE